MKKIVLVMTLALTIMTIACSNNDEDNESEKTKNPLETNIPVQTKAPQTEMPGETQPAQTKAPQGTQSVETENPEGTQMPQTIEPMETMLPEGNKDETQAESNADKYEYVVAYEIVGGENSLDYERCRITINERIEIMELYEVMAWNEYEKLYIGYNDKSYKEIIDMIARKGEILFKDSIDLDVFNNKEIKSITKKKDYKGEEYLVFELNNAYVSEFAQFTDENIGGTLVLECDGEDIMSITIDMAIVDGRFSVKKVPDIQVLDMLSVYIQSGTTFELNPTTV